MSFWSNALTVYTKEVRSLGRDRHTLIYSFALPLFLYPAVVLAMLQGMTYTRGVAERQVSRVGVAGIGSMAGGSISVGARPAVVQDFFSFLEQQPKLEIVDKPADGEPRAHAKVLLDAAEVDVALVLEAGAWTEDTSASGLYALHVELLYDGTRGRSSNALRRVEVAVEEFREQRLEGVAEALGEPKGFLDVLEIHEENLATPQELTNVLAATLLPLLMILMIALGALYPALECTVGEKERKTLETSLLSPVRGSALVLGKYLAVMTFSMTAFLLNFGSMLLVLSHLKFQLGLVELELSLVSALLILAGAVLMVVFLSGVMMFFAFLARSFKEGQTYVTPIFLAALVAALVASAPTVALTPGLAWVPLVNIVLLFRESLTGNFPLLSIAIVFISASLYAALALWAAARLLSQETVATGSDFSWRQALGFLTRGESSRARVQGDAP